ncbi:MAG: hypothetical protein J1E61_00390 [Lachnospiraceae bacterium]|nr:hypothetical protein [Lachnospiraceae bacterium]
MKPEQYTTELRAFFRAMQCRGDKRRLDELMGTEEFRQLSEEAQMAIATHLNISELETEVRGGKKMCRAYEELKKDWRQEGRQEGRKEGIETGKTEEKLQVIQQMIKEGLDEALIQRVTRCTEAEYAKAVRAIREWK